MDPASYDLADIGRDPDAFEAFYRDHLEVVRRFVARRVGNPHDAADLTADIFLAAIDACGRYRPDRGTPAAWLIGIARHAVARSHRTAGRAARADLRLHARDLLDAATDDSVDRLAARIDAERAARSLLLSIARLPRGQRDVVELVAVDGLSLTDAASALGIRPATARVRYHRARTRLVSIHPELTEVTP